MGIKISNDSPPADVDVLTARCLRVGPILVGVLLGAFRCDGQVREAQARHQLVLHTWHFTPITSLNPHSNFMR